MILGIHFGHDASVAVTDLCGKVLLAIQEERLSRRKLHEGIPLRGIRTALDLYGFENIRLVVIGSYINLNSQNALYYYSNAIPFADYRKNKLPNGKLLPIDPGYLKTLNKKFASNSAHQIIEECILTLFPELNGKSFKWVHHHDSHLGCAIGAADRNFDSLLVSLDGRGDGESGAISAIKNENYVLHNRIDELDSLGKLYNAVTSRYGFEPMKHDGKITGLAAYGSYSAAVMLLMKYIKVQNGNVKIVRTKSLSDRIINKANKYLTIPFAKSNLDQIISLAESQTVNYGDLAYAIQFVLEKAVCEIINYWCSHLEISRVSAAGGVFANVKMNQKISELEIVESINIFPNMGDGGISLGGIWYYLNCTSALTKDSPYEDMYLGTSNDLQNKQTLETLISNADFLLTQYESDFNLIEDLVELIANKKIVGIINGRGEFGPRALGNRSLLMDPRDPNINQICNSRLKRTEFMPFAPIVTDEDFEYYFSKSKNQDLSTFEYMTITCDVKDEVKDSIKGVVHVDGTARPQVVSKRSNLFIFNLLKRYKSQTGCGVLINTSFNVHEEPIVNSLEDGIKLLFDNSIDVIVYSNYVIKKNNSK